jgi:hypothetical protein
MPSAERLSRASNATAMVRAPALAAIQGFDLSAAGPSAGDSNEDLPFALVRRTGYPSDAMTTR